MPSLIHGRPAKLGRGRERSRELRSGGRRAALNKPHQDLVDVWRQEGSNLRDVQIAASHADPRTTMRYDPAHNRLDRHPTTPSPPYMASGT